MYPIAMGSLRSIFTQIPTVGGQHVSVCQNVLSGVAGMFECRTLSDKSRTTKLHTSDYQPASVIIMLESWANPQSTVTIVNKLNIQAKL